MKQVATLVSRIAAAVGLEGALLLLGTALIAIGTSYISPAGPWIVTGAVILLVAIALAWPAPKKAP